MVAETPGRTRDRILFHLKTRGPQTAAGLASRLGLTTMGARQHLANLQQEGLVEYDDQRHGVGRPRRVWRLTVTAEQRFPQGYADLTLEMLASVRRVFGAAGLDKLVRARTRQVLRSYRQRLPAAGAPLSARVAALAKLRKEEGYMAEWSRQRDGSFALIENHCPICAAAQACQGLCAGELDLFRAALGRGVEVERCEHILDGARRCTYTIRQRSESSRR